MTSLIISCVSAVIASGFFVYGVHLFLSKNKSYELEFIDFVNDYTGAEYALFVDVDDADRTIAIPMESIDKINRLKNKAQRDDDEKT